MHRSGIVVIAVAALGVLGGCATAYDTPAAPPPATPASTTSVPTTSAAPALVAVAVPAKPAPEGPAKPAAPAKPVAAKPAGAAKPVAAKPAAVASVPCSAIARACIDLAHNKAWLLRGGVVEYGPVPITSGRPGYRTPVGTFRVLSRERLHLSREFDNAPMPYSVFFIPGIAFHQGSLGVTSHGCIHLSKAAAIRFFTTLKIGDIVQAMR